MLSFEWSDIALVLHNEKANHVRPFHCCIYEQKPLRPIQPLPEFILLNDRCAPAILEPTAFL